MITEKLQTISDLISAGKDTTAILKINALKEEIGETKSTDECSVCGSATVETIKQFEVRQKVAQDTIVELSEKLGEKVCQYNEAYSDMVAGYEKQLEELHFKLGDKRICNKCGSECTEHPGLDYQFCENCSKDTEDFKRGEPPVAEWHWEENKI